MIFCPTGNQSNLYVTEVKYNDMMQGMPTRDAVSNTTVDSIPRLGDAFNFDDTFLSRIEVEDIIVSREERAEGKAHRFATAKDALRWLHSE